MSTADRLIAATSELLWERGFVGTSPRDIQGRAGAGQGSMYHHFSGKRELAAAAIEHTATRMTAALDEFFSRPATPLERLTAYLKNDRDVLKGCALGRLVQDPEVMSDSALREPIARFFESLHQRLATLVEESKSIGELPRRLDAGAIADSVVASLQGGYVIARAQNTQEPFNSAVQGLLDLLALAAAQDRGS
jgi:AcrR family transcriptional regulator